MSSSYLPATWSLRELIDAFLNAPTYHLIFEVLLIVWIVKLLFQKSYKPEKPRLTEKEKQELIDEWQPEPLVPDVDPNHPALKAYERVVDGPLGKWITINGKKCLNMGTMNFLNFVGNNQIEEASIKTLRVYGVGSCGPRGFYGTMDVHLDLEERLAKFMSCEEAAVYSYGFSTIASIIPAYSKRTDIIFCDMACAFAIQKGVQASKSTVKWFKHNDMTDLERLLADQERADKRDPKRARNTRKFIVVEGLYMNTGDLCPLKELVALKYKYKVRLFIDESVSFGVVGTTGRGVTEHFGVSPDHVDCLSGSLECALASIGGFSVGTKYVVDHQRLSALGYCFSASLPPLLATAAIEALHIIESDGERLIVSLRSRVERVAKQLSVLPGCKLDGDSTISPILHLRLADTANASGERPAANLSWREKLTILEEIVYDVQDNGVALTVARYLEEEELFLPEPSIRISINVALTDEEIDRACNVIRDSAAKALQKHALL